MGLLAVAIATPGAAQTSGGSTYSIFNIGDLRIFSTAAAAARGGIEASVPSPSTINSINPAAWSDIRLVTLQASMNFEQYQVSDPTGKISQNSSRLQDFSVAFPYSEQYGGAIAFSIHPYSTVNYRTQVKRDVQLADSTTTARVDYTGQGGISEVTGGASFRPVEWLTLGAAGSAFFGSIHSESQVSFPSATLNPASYQTSDLFVGWGFRGGFHIDPVENLRIGGAFESGSNLTHERIASSIYSEADTTLIDTSSQTETTFKLPSRVTVGGSYIIGRNMVSLEGSMQSWGTEQFTTSRPASRVAVGYDYLPSGSVNASGLERWTFRLGGYYENTYYQLENGTGINQMGVTLGARYPLGGSANGLGAGTAFDVAIELGQRGTTDNNLTKEMFGKLSLELSVSELWFVRARR